MFQIPHYTETGEVHPDLLALSPDDQKLRLQGEKEALGRVAKQRFNSKTVQEEIEIKLHSVQTILDNLG